LIFANPDGTPLKPNSISATVSLLCRRLGLPKGASLHTLRHTHGSFLLTDGVDLATVSERLGHSSVRVTADIYSHALVAAIRKPPTGGTTSCGKTAHYAMSRNQ
jgi:site-specific recombinase XerD